ncbi:MAG TPA: prepilin-type N-terminal cleavage/methylation domain-containing protein [Opitutaceae bacterium]
MPSTTKKIDISRTNGFTLPELIVGLMLLTFFALISVRTVIAAHRFLPGRTVEVSGVDLPIAPSISAFTAAVHLHSVFTERLRQARAVYVFGGSHQGIASTASRCAVAPLALRGLPEIDDFPAGLPLDTLAFHQAYASQLGSGETAPARDDFTVVIVGAVNGALKVTALAQVRSSNVVLHDGSSSENFVRRTVDLYDISGESRNYSFLERAELAKESAVGAHHFWYRYAEGRVAEEGPATVIFPDPWPWARAASGPAMPAVSRFVYCVCVDA